MAGLFTMPTPDEVRQQARASNIAQASLFTQAPRGRGIVQAAGQAGGLFGQAIGELTGGINPEQEKALKFQQIQNEVMGELGDVDLSTPQGFLQMTDLAAKKFTEAGMPDLAQQAAMQGLSVREKFKAQPKDQYAAILNEKGQVIAQRNLATNKVESDPRAPKDPDTVIQNYLGDQDQLAKSLSKAFGEDIVKRRNDALDARNSLLSANSAVDLLNSGVITGTGAEFIVGLGKGLQQIGFNIGKNEVANTEAFYANQAKQVAQIIKAFGAGTGLSDADREYAERAAAGKITMTESSIRKIIDLNATASRNVMERFNSDVSRIPRESMPIDLSISIPEFKGVDVPAEPEQQWGIRKLD